KSCAGAAYTPSRTGPQQPAGGELRRCCRVLVKAKRLTSGTYSVLAAQRLPLLIALTLLTGSAGTSVSDNPPAQRNLEAGGGEEAGACDSASTCGESGESASGAATPDASSQSLSVPDASLAGMDAGLVPDTTVVPDPTGSVSTLGDTLA